MDSTAVAVWSLSCVRLFVTPCTASPQACLSFTISQSLLKLMSTELIMPSNHHPLSPPSPPALNLSQHQGLFQWVTLCIRWPRYWSFSFSTSTSKEYSGLISFRIDWLDLAVQRTFKSIFQHHSLKVLILQHSAFFMVQLSHLYMTTGKFIALTTWTFVGKVMSLLFNMLSRLVIIFLPRSKHLLTSWLGSTDLKSKCQQGCTCLWRL